MATQDEKKAALEKKAEQIKAQLAKLNAKENEQKRKNETRLKVLIGAALLHSIHSKKDEQAAERLKKSVINILTKTITAPRDREFLKEQGFIDETLQNQLANQTTDISGLFKK